MKSYKNLLEQLGPLPYFSKDMVCQLGRQMELKDASIDTYISRFIRQKEILQLKNGLYISGDFYKRNKNDFSYLFYLANIIRTPSYVSSWAALQYYNLSTEAIRVFTSVTPKVTRTYKTKIEEFSYQSINKELFSGFILVKGSDGLIGGRQMGGALEGIDFFIASPSKALFDLLYYKTHQFHGVRKKDINGLIDELRIDIGEMGKKERIKFHEMIKKAYL